MITSEVPTTDLAERDILLHWGLLLQLQRRRVSITGRGGPAVAFDGIVLNIDDVTQAARDEDPIARFIVGSVWRNNSTTPIYTIRGYDSTIWSRVLCPDGPDGCGLPARRLDFRCKVHAGMVEPAGQAL